MTQITNALPRNRPVTLVVIGKITAASAPQAPAIIAPMPKVIA